MELFEQIRREYEHGAEAVRAVAWKLGVHRRMERQALAKALPPERKRPGRECPRLGPVKAFIEAILEADRKAPRKQRHTAHRIWQRVRAEHPECAVAESSVRRDVGQRRRALGLLKRETLVPQSYAWGQEAQADWYEAEAELGGERAVLQVFSLRSMARGGAFHRAYRRALSEFDPERVAHFAQKQIQKLKLDRGIIQNRMKIEAAPRNTWAFLKYTTIRSPVSGIPGQRSVQQGQNLVPRQ